jgi:hypothetical protein
MFKKWGQILEGYEIHTKNRNRVVQTASLD